MNYYAIIVAGGSGNRMNNSIPKQFLLLADRPVMMHAIEVFYNCPLQPKIVVVLGRELQVQWAELCSQYNFTFPHLLVDSGVQRFHSVKNGLSTIDGDGIVAIHDAARPLVSQEVVLRSYEIAEKLGNCVTGISPVDSIRFIDGEGISKAVERADFRLIQTPQTFQVNELRKAYEVEFRNEFTDDASVMESFGTHINLIEGNRENIKITYPLDLEIASVLIKKKRA